MKPADAMRRNPAFPAIRPAPPGLCSSCPGRVRHRARRLQHRQEHVHQQEGQGVKPAELTEITPSVSVTRLWSANAGKGEGLVGARQAPAIADGRVYAAAVHGGVHAFDLKSGASVWHYASKLALSGGPGVGDGLVVAGGLDGDVIALDAATGAEKWKAKVGNEIIAAPVIGQGMVFVHSNDGRVTAFDETSGQRRWFWTHEVPTLPFAATPLPCLARGTCSSATTTAP